MHGMALKMRCELRELAKRHRVPPPTPYIDPGLPPTDDSPCVLSGLCSDYSVDLERVRFRKYSLLWSPYRLPPLYLRHDTSRVIGSVDQLEDSDDGVRVSVTTDHASAMRCGAFSIAATINAYHLERIDTPQFCAVVESATLDEISLVDRPCNPRALVFERAPAKSPWHDHNALLLRWIDTMRQLVQLTVAQAKLNKAEVALAMVAAIEGAATPENSEEFVARWRCCSARTASRRSGPTPSALPNAARGRYVSHCSSGSRAA
jgi:hypothetical protein